MERTPSFESTPLVLLSAINTRHLTMYQSLTVKIVNNFQTVWKLLTILSFCKMADLRNQPLPVALE
jgi:hypothetical protein